jgi:endogenous inhibitor of DNA gyrase (YacG/DUF329 family)
LAAERLYTAPCPGCGAPVEFKRAQSTHAVCSFCRSTVVRDGATLSRVGKMAELFDDHSPLQLGARGTWEARAFTVVGRLQYRGAEGPWTEWHCLFEDGGTALLAEDNGRYVMAVAAQSQRELPAAERFRIGATTAVSGKSYQVTSNEQVALVAAEGELPKLPPRDTPFAMVELRSPDNEVLAVDYGSTPPALTRGRPANLDELRFTGLREEIAREDQGRQFSCPQCGAPVEVQFSGSKSITCRSCKSLIDLSAGIVGELRHAEQDEPVEPLIPLGSVGQLQGVHWQVVGFQHRVGSEAHNPDEHFGWDEYLLYSRKRGFAFLVDSTDGWSMVKTTTGAPSLKKDMQSATYLGQLYRQKYAYQAQTSFVEGEFYWPVERGQSTFNRDYVHGSSVLSMEENARERTWSLGGALDGDTVAKAFGLAARKDLLKRGDGGPLTPRGSGGGSGCGTILLIVLIVLVVIMLLKACDDDENSGGSGYTSSGRGGSYSGGSHK